MTLDRETKYVLSALTGAVLLVGGLVVLVTSDKEATPQVEVTTTAPLPPPPPVTVPKADRFPLVFDRVLKHEGGATYTNHPADPGGPTKYGITIHDVRKYLKPGATASDVKK